MKMKACQSCGMPLYKAEMYGTDSDGIPIEDYCTYCYKNGKYTSDVTMEEMIELCAKYVQGNTKEAAIARMKVQFPTLKRWAKKEETQSEYYKSINKVLDYIHHHLSEKPNINKLADIANISPYHFLRIFKATIGEGLGEYVQRLRLEYVAEQLKHSNASMNQLAEEIGYSNEQSLSRAFKKRFKLPPSVFKASFYKQLSEQLSPRICHIASKEAMFLNKSTTDKNNHATAWQRLYFYAVLKRLFYEDSESLELITSSNDGTPELTPCVSITGKHQASNIATSISIEGGLYAIFTYKGSHSMLLDLYKSAHNYWLPKSKYRLRDGYTFFKYLNNTGITEREDLLTELYIPIE